MQWEFTDFSKGQGFFFPVLKRVEREMIASVQQSVIQACCTKTNESSRGDNAVFTPLRRATLMISSASGRLWCWPALHAYNPGLLFISRILSKPSPSTKSTAFSQPCATSWHSAAAGLNQGLSKWRTPCCWDTAREWKRKQKERALFKTSRLQIRCCLVYLSLHLWAHMFWLFHFLVLSLYITMVTYLKSKLQRNYLCPTATIAQKRTNEFFFIH